MQSLLTNKSSCDGNMRGNGDGDVSYTNIS